jgi:hypothetical protein
MNSLSALESIFVAALDKRSAEDRAAYLDEACGHDSELRRHMERLLNAQASAGSFLQDRVPGPAGTIDQQPQEQPGTIIGPYKLLQQIGEGGMGVVYMAEQQEPIRRKVALKIIKPGMDSTQVIARFEAERQALALMDHQNIWPSSRSPSATRSPSRSSSRAWIPPKLSPDSRRNARH